VHPTGCARSPLAHPHRVVGGNDTRKVCSTPLLPWLYVTIPVRALYSSQRRLALRGFPIWGVGDETGPVLRRGIWYIASRKEDQDRIVRPGERLGRPNQCEAMPLSVTRQPKRRLAITWTTERSPYPAAKVTYSSSSGEKADCGRGHGRGLSRRKCVEAGYAFSLGTQDERKDLMRSQSRWPSAPLIPSHAEAGRGASGISRSSCASRLPRPPTQNHTITRATLGRSMRPPSGIMLASCFT